MTDPVSECSHRCSESRLIDRSVRVRRSGDGPAAGSSPIPQDDVDRSGPHAYDDLEPELRRHAAADPGDPGYDVRRERLIREFLPLVRNLARRFATSGPLQDIEQAGVVGLITAIDRYDPASTSGGPLGYLVPSVRGPMLRYLRDHTWALRVPRELKDTAVRLNRASVVLGQRLGRSPRPSELARELDLPVDTVVETLGALDSYRPASLDMPDPTTGEGVGDRVGAEDALFDLVEHRAVLRDALAALPERERMILLLRFHGDQTQSQIGERVGLSQMHVSRLLSRTLADLRARLSVDEPSDDQPPVKETR